MNESFTNHFRKPEQDLKIRNSAHFTEQEMSEFLAETVDFLSENYRQNRENALDLEEEFGENIKEKMAFVLKEAVAYFQNLGIDSVKFNEVFYLQGNLDTEAGNSNRNQGTIIHAASIGLPEIKQLRFLKFLAHELYHSTAMASLTVIDSLDVEKNHLTRFVDKQEGASYSPTSGESNPLALEEGLAAQFESSLFKKIRQLYKKDTVSLYDELIEESYSQFDPKQSEKDDVSIYELSVNGDFRPATAGYAPGRRLVRFLETHIPEFHQLVEQARLDRHPLPLARAIGNMFGKDAYRMITTAEVSEADEIIEKLTQALKQ
jgi:hypothetical protein